MDAVGCAGVGIGKNAPVTQVRLIVFPEDGEGIDGGGAARVGGARAVDQVGIGDVDRLFARGEADAARAAEAIRHGADVARRRIEAVDLLRELGFGAKPLFVAINGIGEPHRPVSGDDDVVGRVEGPGMIVVQQRDGLVRPFGFHVDQPGGLAQRTLRTQDQAVAVICAAAGHKVSLGASHFVAGEIGRGKELDLSDDNGLVMGGDCVRRRIRELVRGDEQGVGGWVEDARFVEEGGARIVDQDLQTGRRAEDPEEGVVVYEERLGLRGGEGSRGDSGTVSASRDRSNGRRDTHCHNASLWRLTSCQLRSSGNRRCCEPDRGEGESEAEADDGRSLPRLSDPDLLESENATLVGTWSAVFGLRRSGRMFDACTLASARRRRGQRRIKATMTATDDARSRPTQRDQMRRSIATGNVLTFHASHYPNCRDPWTCQAHSQACPIAGRRPGLWHMVVCEAAHHCGAGLS